MSEQKQPTVRVCTKCHVCKSLDEFNKRKGGRYGKMSYCKVCQRVSQNTPTAKDWRWEYVHRPEIRQKNLDHCSKIVVCECGKEISNGKKSRHRKSKKHIKIMSEQVSVVV